MTAGIRGFRILAVEGIDGSGKTTLLRRVAEAMGSAAHMERLSPHMGAVFRELVDSPADSSVRYQDVIPGSLRRFAYVADAISQFHYLDSAYSSHDWVLFDRWLPTYDVYCEGESAHDEWCRELAGLLPVPDLLIRLRTSPKVAAGRVRSRGDWTADHWSPQRLLEDLTRLDLGYDRALAETPHVVVDGDRGADAVYEEVLGLVRAVG
ncbi:hypothetical protein ACGFSI_15690 [Streptomyces virginiae]|uniref:hypothetical protein n=1 Tax=Streptomyces virginiae TaxID=1961 RepID=UPI00371736E8